jgi:hypothetical protein
MEEAYMLFEQEGERRSVRMIAEYCKNGELVCFYDSDDKRWHITRNSVENKIEKIKALNARKTAAASQNTSEQPFESPATSQRPADDRPPQNEPPHESSDVIKKLEQEILDLKIVNRGKDYFIEQLQKERDGFITRIEGSSHRIGALETKLLQIEGPQREPRNASQPLSQDTPWRERESDQIPLTNSNSAPASDTHYGAPLIASDNINDHYDHSSQDPFAEEQR